MHPGRRVLLLRDLFPEFFIQSFPNRCELGSKKATRSPERGCCPGLPAALCPTRLRPGALRGCCSRRGPRASAGSRGGGGELGRPGARRGPAAPAQCAGGGNGDRAPLRNNFARPRPRPPGLGPSAWSPPSPSPPPAASRPPPRPRAAAPHRCRTGAARTCRTGCCSWRSRPPC